MKAILMTVVVVMLGAWAAMWVGVPLVAGCVGVGAAAVIVFDLHQYVRTR